MNKTINVTSTFLPPLEELMELLRPVWETGWITNRGSLVRSLEDKLKERFEIRNVLALTNGTLPLQVTIKALKIKGEVITTPFSYVATTSSLVWENCTPIFVDIDPDHLTIDENKIEASITPKTTAILATHVYGNPCNVNEIDKIAKKYNLKVIYDAAHCFGVRFNGKSIFNFGDVSTCSFHATKLFHTGEGGALFTNNTDLFQKLFYHHNFGHSSPESFQGLGINAKMNEMQAALGLLNLNYVDEIKTKRKDVVNLYLNELQKESLKFLKIRENTDWNYSYFPVLFDSEKSLKKAVSKLNAAEIFPRRYFYPSLNLLPYISNQSCPVSEDISQRILCLPLAHNLSKNDVIRICNILKE